jgi:DNA-binding transcriptional regulator YdaS (Cro superfamily)
MIRGMRTDAAIQYFGSHSELAKALGIQAPSVYGWGEFPPDAKQLLIEKVTKGKLAAEPGCFERLIGLDKVDQ